MPIFVDSPDFNATQLSFQQGSSRSVTIGLVNNMPDEARYMMPDVPRQEAARR
jgi:hypothetical protein